MRQRTKLAQAIVGDPELVLLDEPTAGLDPVGRDDMLALVARLGSFGISVLMATHLLDDVQKVCDHVVMIDAGRLVVAGATDSLLERTGTVTVDVGPRGEELVAALAPSNLPAVAADGLVEVEIDGDDDLDVLRDVIAELELPLYRLSTRLTSLDEVFLRRAEDFVVSLIEARTRRCGLRPRLPPVRRARAASAARRRSPCTRRRCGARWASGGRGGRRLRRSCCSAIVTIPAIVNVGIGYVTRDRFFSERIEIITYRDYVGVSAALLLFVALVAPDVMCPDRRQHVLPLMFARPITGVDYVLAKLGAIATILFAFSFLPQVVLFVGNMLVSDSALDYFTGHLDVLWKVPARGRCCWPCTTPSSASRSRRSPTAASSRARRSSACSSSRRSRRRSSSATSSSKAGRPPRSSTCSRCRCTCAIWCSSATSIPSRRSPA